MLRQKGTEKEKRRKRVTEMGQRLVKEGLGFQPCLPRCEAATPQNEGSTAPGGSVREGTEERHMMIEGLFSRDTATLDTHAPHDRASSTAGQTPTERQEEQVVGGDISGQVQQAETQRSG